MNSNIASNRQGPASKIDPPLPFPSARTKVLDLRRRWPKIRPIVQTPKIRNLLHRCLRDYMSARKQTYILKHAKRGEDTSKLFRYSKKRPPIGYSDGDGWLYRRMVAPDSVGWFQVRSAGHFLARWALVVASIYMPHLNWEIRRSDLHSTVVGCLDSGEVIWIFDILAFEDLTSDQILTWTRKVDPAFPDSRDLVRPRGRRGLFS